LPRTILAAPIGRRYEDVRIALIDARENDDGA